MELGKINIDFQVLESGDPNILMIADFSSWLHIENQPSVISITLPGSSIPVRHNFVKNNINGFNSNTLNITCSYNCDNPDYVPLPDGIYEILLEASPNTFNQKRYYLKLDNTRLELDKQLVRLGLDFDINSEERVNHIQLIDFLLLAASANTRLGDIPKASEHFTEALRLLEKYKDCKNCL